MIEAGAVAILTISASTGYAVSECMGRSSSFNLTFKEAAPFYSINVVVAAVAAAVILIPGVPLLSIALNANVLATVLLPFTLAFVVMLANDRQLMGRWANGLRSNLMAGTIVGDRPTRTRGALDAADLRADRRPDGDLHVLRAALATRLIAYAQALNAPTKKPIGQ